MCSCLGAKCTKLIAVRATAEVRLDRDAKGTGISHTSCRRSKEDEITKYSNLIHIRTCRRSKEERMVLGKV